MTDIFINITLAHPQINSAQKTCHWMFLGIIVCDYSYSKLITG